MHPVARLPEDWKEELGALGERPFRAQQIFRWIHARGVFEPEKMSDLAAKVRAWLVQQNIGGFAEVERVHLAADKTRKLVLALEQGVRIETVLIPAHDGASDADGGGALDDADAAAADTDDDDAAVADTDAGNAAVAGTDGNDESSSCAVPDPATRTANRARGRRLTQCISTQVGCAMGCAFCASGRAGLKRGLGAHEIVAQVLLGKKHIEPGEELRNVVLMGMGEPLHNYEETARALRLLMHPHGVNLSPRRITISTVGLVPELQRLGKDFNGQIGLAVSLHAADDETRMSLLPINRKYKLAELMGALRAYPLPRRRRIFIEYTLIEGRNDTRSDAKKLAKLLRDVPVKINLIPMNPVEGSPLQPPPMDRVYAFQQILIDTGYTCFVRRRRGDDVSAACGQLALAGAKARVRTVGS